MSDAIDIGPIGRQTPEPFTDAEVALLEATADQIVLAGGSRAAIPDIDGLTDVPFHTSDSIMRIDDVPRRLAILRARRRAPRGCARPCPRRALRRPGSVLLRKVRPTRSFPG